MGTSVGKGVGAGVVGAAVGVGGWHILHWTGHACWSCGTKMQSVVGLNQLQSTSACPVTTLAAWSSSTHAVGLLLGVPVGGVEGVGVAVGAVVGYAVG